MTLTNELLLTHRYFAGEVLKAFLLDLGLSSGDIRSCELTTAPNVTVINDQIVVAYPSFGISEEGLLMEKSLRVGMTSYINKYDVDVCIRSTAEFLTVEFGHIPDVAFAKPVYKRAAQNAFC